ncbi:MAG TPA: hypothetical protein VLA46_11350 [Saprospiraceae bacterium]|nr:hypothetical protein [Saprospiraceae bacterium]
MDGPGIGFYFPGDMINLDKWVKGASRSAAKIPPNARHLLREDERSKAEVPNLL